MFKWRRTSNSEGVDFYLCLGILTHTLEIQRIGRFPDGICRRSAKTLWCMHWISIVGLFFFPLREHYHGCRRTDE